MHSFSMLTFSPHIDGIGFLYCEAVFVGIIQYGDSYHLRPIGVFQALQLD